MIRYWRVFMSQLVFSQLSDHEFFMINMQSFVFCNFPSRCKLNM
jgi:hypothetical protein